MYAERLYIHTHSPDEFRHFLAKHQIQYDNALYSDFGTIKSQYTFMSEPDFTFAQFMTGVPTYKYLPVLQDIVFDQNVRWTAADNWNYYGEPIRRWLPAMRDLLKLAGVVINSATKTLAYAEEEARESGPSLLPYAFGDQFLDNMRREANAAFAAGHYLSVMFLSRKMLEASFVRLFEVVFPKLVNGQYSAAHHDLWYDKRRNNFHSLDTLITNLSTNAGAFHEDTRLVKELCSLAKPFKDETNACVHLDYKAPTQSYVEQWRLDYVLGLARRLFKKYCNP